MAKGFTARQRDYLIKKSADLSEDAKKSAAKALGAASAVARETADKLEEFESKQDQFQNEASTLFAALVLAVAGTWRERRQMRRILRLEMKDLLAVARKRMAKPPEAGGWGKG